MNLSTLVASSILLAFVVVISLLAMTTITTVTTTSTTTTTTAIPLVYGQNVQNGSFNIAVAGDWGCTEETQKTANNIENKDPELVLAPGDFSYEDTGDCWYDIIAPFESKTKIAIGNHDDEENGSEQLRTEYMNRFNLTQSFYSFNYKNVHVLVMDTQIDYEEGSEQYNFVVDDLHKASTDPNTDWIFVMFHKPMYSIPSSHSALHSLRTAYHPLFDRYGVDLVIQAHNHIYGRTIPMGFNSDDIGAPLSDIRSGVNSNTRSYYTSPSYPMFVIVGTGGQSLYDIEGERPYVAYSSDEDYGFLNIDIINEKMLSAKFYSNSESGGNSVKDEFIISKGEQPPVSVASVPPAPPTSVPASTPNANEPKEMQNAREYIVKSYNNYPTIKLVREVITKDRYWLWSDNVFAEKILRETNYNPQLAAEIRKSIDNYKKQYNLEMRVPYSVLLDNQTGSVSFGSTISEKDVVGNIWYSDYSGGTELDSAKYGDIAFLRAIYLHKQNDTAAARASFDKGVAMFDGKGIADSAFTGTYALYKMALWKIAADRTGFPQPPQPFTNDLLKKAQDANGGFRTDYDSSLNIDGSTNIETTALVIWANPWAANITPRVPSSSPSSNTTSVPLSATNNVTAMTTNDSRTTTNTTNTNNTNNTPSSFTAASPLPSSSSSSSPFPITSVGTFYYPWYGHWRHWQDGSHNPPKTWQANYLPDTNSSVFDPSTELYSSNKPDVLRQQLGWMKKAGIQFAISSWWGQNSYEDNVFANIINNIMSAEDNQFPELKWTILYEAEGFSNPSVSELVSDLNYIKTKYTNSKHYLKINNKPVIFVYNAAHTGYDPLEDLARWKQARDLTGFYVVFKVDPLPKGASTSEMDSWYQYSPAVRYDQQGNYSAMVSPGFWKYHEEARLVRSVDDFEAAVQKLAAANVKFKLVTTWNEWGEGTGVEPAQEIKHDDRDGFSPAAPSYGNIYLNILGKYLGGSNSEFHN